MWIADCYIFSEKDEKSSVKARVDSVSQSISLFYRLSFVLFCFSVSFESSGGWFEFVLS